MMMMFPIGVDDVDLRSGHVVVLGPNGSGKTRLLRAIQQAAGRNAEIERVRYLSAGRSAPLEIARANLTGRLNPAGQTPSFGGKKEREHRHQAESIIGDLQAMYERPDLRIKVEGRIRSYFQREISLEFTDGVLQAFFTAGEAVPPYSAAAEASGILLTTSLMAALYDDAVDALLIDEPEVSLHPQLQAIVANEIERALVSGAKKLVVVATHSPYMFRISGPEDFENLIICREGEAPAQLTDDKGLLKTAPMRATIARLSTAARAALFTRHPFFVEGPSDELIAVGVATHLDIPLDASAQILAGVGREELPKLLKLYRTLGYEPVVLADLDAALESSHLASAMNYEEACNARAQDLGASRVSDLRSVAMGQLSDLAIQRWNEIAPLVPEGCSYLPSGRDPNDEEKRRCALVAILQTMADDLGPLSGDGAWRTAKASWENYLDALATGRCHILRRGTIEDYYASATIESGSKPLLAVDQLASLSLQPSDQLREQFDDVVTALLSAVSLPQVDEVAALRELLIAASGPALAGLRAGSGEDPNAAARRVLGDRSSLFNLKATGGGLVVELSSSILAVDGFPLTIASGDDPVAASQRITSRP